jgi:1-acyl-sn-glycerol-3-phosphate acyltransferase
VAAARRTATLALLLALIPLAAAAFVVSALVASALRPARRGWGRAVRITGFALCYLLADLAGLLAAVGLWLRRPRRRPSARAARGAGAYALLARLLVLLRRAADRAFRLEVVVEPAVPGPSAVPPAPLLVFVRHAGPGDSFLLLQILLAEAGLRPHTVLKGSLRADPCLDVLLGRVPHCFLPPRHGTGAEAIGALAAGLRPGDALVLFPEGGNFTPGRHRRAVASLLRQGQVRRARRAGRLHHVLPPRDAGVLAALEAAPTADVVFVTHSGLDLMDSARSVWRALPLDHPVRARWWRIPAARVPAPEARSAWLLAQWDRVDAWIEENAPAGASRV